MEKDLTDRLAKQDRLLEQFIGQVASRNSNDAVKSARELLDDLNQTILQIEKSYAKRLVEAKMPTFTEDRQSVDGGSDMSQADLTRLAHRLARYVSTVRAEANRFRSQRRPQWIDDSAKWVTKFRKEVLIGVGATVGVAVIASLTVYTIRRGRGLTGSYYGNTKLAGKSHERRDSSIDFNWERGSAGGKKRDRFSIRWKGFLRVPSDGTYGFATSSDDGSRLFLGKNLLINNWEIQPRRKEASIDLKAGYYPIRVEYFEASGRAFMRLEWKRPGATEFSTIPARYLVPTSDALKSRLPVHEDAGSVQVTEEDEEASEQEDEE